MASGQHGAAADDDCRDIDASGSHEHARHDFIAVGDHDQSVEGVAVGDGFDGVADELAAGQRVFHAVVAHGDAVADADGRKFDRRTAGGGDAQLDGFGDVPQVHVAGDDFVKGVDHANQRLLQVFVAVAHGVKQGAVGRTGASFFYYVASHINYPFVYRVYYLMRICLTGMTPRDKEICPVLAISMTS